MSVEKRRPEPFAIVDSFVRLSKLPVESWTSRATAITLGLSSMEPTSFFRSLFEQASAQGSRSTAIKPLGWLVAMTLSSTLGSFAVGGPLWLGIVLAIGATASIAAYLISYFYLMIRSPDSLRSETFTLKKLAIEKGIYGDSFVGSLEIDSAGSPKLLGPSSVQSQPGNEP